MINGHRQGDCERFALVALFKRATVSDSDPSLLTKEQPWQIARFLWAKSNMSDFLVNQAARSQNRAIRDSIWQFFNDFPLFYAQERIAPVTLHSVALFWEQFALVALYKRATVSDSLMLLMTKERWERFALFHDRITLWLTKNEWFTWKTNDRIPNPGNRQ